MVLRAIETLWPLEAAIRQNVEIVDLSIGPAGLLDYLPGRFGLVLIDAMQGKTGGEALLDVNCAEVEALPLALDSPRSSHGMGLGWQLRLAGQLALMPRHARLIALPIAGAEVGGGMSPGALEQVRPAAERAVRWCAAYATLWHAAGRAEAAT
jgi:Ni,Fe-hydrogenase maturation factor